VRELRSVATAALILAWNWPSTDKYSYVSDHKHVICQWYNETLPNGVKVRAHYMGEIYSGIPQGYRLTLNDEWLYQGNYWIWMVPAGKSVPQWVDP
jgi:hypothetical protein